MPAWATMRPAAANHPAIIRPASVRSGMAKALSDPPAIMT